MPSPAIQRAAAIVELMLIRSKRSRTTASKPSPGSLVRATVSRQHILGASLQRLAQRQQDPPLGCCSAAGSAGGTGGARFAPFSGLER